ncbi:basic amino acid ABC transporter substrate-binding protein [Shewanella algae]|uniref:basic amino acid ABC transporter substrate-binding protein n=1 Tax=Shewanella algae TaxID=38313 RepID=UPI0031F48667
MKKSLLLAAVTALLLTGCGKDQDVLVVGTNATFPPFEYMGGANGDEVKGLDIDIAKAIADDAGKTLKVENLNFDALIVALNSGKVDFIASGMTITDERKESVNFSTPYYEATQVVIVNQDSPEYKTPADLAGKKIAVQLGSTGDIIAKELKADVVAFNSGFEAFMELKNHRVDMVLFDSQPAAEHLAKNPTLKQLNVNFSPEFYGIAVPKDKPELLKQINATLSRLKSSGEYKQLIEKYQK